MMERKKKILIFVYITFFVIAVIVLKIQVDKWNSDSPLREVLENLKKNVCPSLCEAEELGFDGRD